MNNLNIGDYRRAYLFWPLLVSLVGLIFVYLYLVNNFIFEIVKHQRYLDTLSQIQAEVVTLEGEYLRRTGQITLDLARQLGYREAITETMFVTADQNPLALVRRSP